MPTTCSVIGCNGKTTDNKLIHYFRFPVKDRTRLNKWLAAINRETWKPTGNNRICSKHFSEDLISCKGDSHKGFLDKSAVPTLCIETMKSPKTKVDLKSIYFSAINLKSVAEAEKNAKIRRSSRNILNEKNNQIERIEEPAKPKKDSIGRTLLKKILPAPCRISRKDETKTLLKKTPSSSPSDHLATKLHNLSKKMKRQTAKMNMMQEMIAEIVKRNNAVVKDVAACMKKKNLVDAEISVLLQDHLSSIQRLETEMRTKS